MYVSSGSYFLLSGHMGQKWGRAENGRVTQRRALESSGSGGPGDSGRLSFCFLLLSLLLLPAVIDVVVVLTLTRCLRLCHVTI